MGGTRGFQFAHTTTSRQVHTPQVARFVGCGWKTLGGGVRGATAGPGFLRTTFLGHTRMEIVGRTKQDVLDEIEDHKWAITDLESELDGFDDDEGEEDESNTGP